MVRHQSPAMSIRASGTIADNLTFSTWKGRAYSRRRVIPTDHRTPAQFSARELMRCLQYEWKIGSQGNKDSWKTYPSYPGLPAYQCYLKENVTRWYQGKPPCFHWPATPLGPYPGAAIIDAADPGVREVVITLEGGPPSYYEFLFVFRSTQNPCPAATDQLRWARHTAGEVATLHLEAETGVTYYYAARYANPTALFGPITTFGPLTAL